MSRVLRKPRAAEDIADVWDYIANDNLAAADRWVDRLDEQFRMIAQQPLMGRAREELGARLRSFPFGRYVVFYTPLADGIEVVRVLHSARNVGSMLGGP